MTFPSFETRVFDDGGQYSNITSPMSQYVARLAFILQQEPQVPAQLVSMFLSFYFPMIVLFRVQQS